MAWIRACGGGNPYIPDPDPVNFGYTGNVQTYEVTKTGIYQLEVYGGQGGDVYTPTSGSYVAGTSYGGRGGYAKGNVRLTKGQTIYVVIGGSGVSGNYLANDQTCAGGYNGGGYGRSGHGVGAGGGGGATHIGKTNSILKDTTLSNLYIVAGGGGGAARGYSGFNGGAGGGTNGGSAGGAGGSQTAGGGNGSYGQGGNSGGVENAGGGGGFYGGGCGGYSAGGGSGYVGGCISGTASMSNGQRSGTGLATISWVSE